jgi:hypothetical protein
MVVNPQKEFNMKKLLVTLLAMTPFTVSADYDVERIKQNMKETEIFHIQEWRQNEAGNAWIANHALKNTTIMAGEKNAGIVALISNQTEALSAMITCMMMGHVGLGVEGDGPQKLVSDAIESGKKRQLTHDNVSFTVEPAEMANTVSLNCIVKPTN